jgi:hypothetical protein
VLQPVSPTNSAQRITQAGSSHNRSITYSNPSTLSKGEQKVPFTITPSANFVPVIPHTEDAEEVISENDEEAIDPDLTRVFGERDRQFK